MKLEDVQKSEDDERLEQIVSARVPLRYKTYIIRNKIVVRKLIMKAIDEIDDDRLNEENISEGMAEIAFDEQQKAKEEMADEQEGAK
jgi:hypothetical protein